MHVVVQVDETLETFLVPCRRSHTVDEIKRIVEKEMGFPTSSQALFEAGRELEGRLMELGIEEGTVLLLVLRDPTDAGRASGITYFGSAQRWPPRLSRALEDVRKGLEAGSRPRLSDEGEGSTYFMRNEGYENVAVFKPQDEEPFTPNNIKGWRGKVGQIAFRTGILSGEGCQREAAAFLLDHDNMAGVPATGMVKSWHETYANGDLADDDTSAALPQKLGAFQEFVHFDGFAEDWSNTKFSVGDVQRIALLDIRLLNLDRNSTNLLVKQDRATRSFRLIPIDHGLCLPDTLEVHWYSWVWLNWKQVKQPLLPELKAYVEGLDADRDIAMLREELNIRPECLRTLRITYAVLKKGVAAGMTLHDIANLICRQSDTTLRSELEDMCARASTLVDTMFRNSRARGTLGERPRPTPSSSLSRTYSIHSTSTGTGSPALTVDSGQSSPRQSSAASVSDTASVGSGSVGGDGGFPGVSAPLLSYGNKIDPELPNGLDLGLASKST